MPSMDPERRDALPVGTVLREFTIQAVIGHGGFGIVYRAEHNELDLTVAIKEYLPVELAVREGATVQPRSGTDRKDFEDGLRRFRDEAQALIDFDSHPSIVSCREFFRAHGTAYLVMAYEEGQSLAELLASREAEGRPFTEQELLAVMTPVLEGLARVHAAGVLHRDIKPSNILIRRSDGRPVLIDFGAAKQAAAKYTKSQAPYTEGYAALEQVADTGKLGPWTDMYGVGAVMWRMVAGGNRPWEPPHPVCVELRSHAVVDDLEDPMPPARDLGRGRFASQVLESIDQCLRLRGTERIQGSRELLEVLHVGSDQSAVAVSVEASQPSTRRAVAVGTGEKSSSEPTVPGPRNARRWAGWMMLASVSVGLCLALAAWWSQGSGEAIRDQGSEGVMDAPGGDATATTDRGEEVDSEASPSPQAENREPPLDAIREAQTPDPTEDDSSRKEDPSEAEVEGGNDDRPEVSPERPQVSFEQPWVRDWEALGGGIEDAGFAAAAQAYIARYREVPEAGVWVARAEGLMAKLKELEAVDRTRREPSRRPENREPPLDANKEVRTPDPTENESSRKEDPSEAEVERGNDNRSEVSLERPQGSFEQPWVRDWEALGGGIEDPGFAAAAQAYIARYREVSEAGVWVARAEGLMAKLNELEAADRTRREVGQSWMNSLGMEFMWIPPGGFLMGSPEDEEGHRVDELRHEVRISEGFWMEKYEVTQGEWESVMGANPSRFSDCGPKCPVEHVSWFDMDEFIQRLNGRESGKGYRYRPPTEAEWEYAARAGTTGARYGELHSIAWYRDNSGSETHPVGRKRANAWGLHDMLGNVWEWTGDWYDRYPSGSVTDPQGPSTGSYRVIRGGSWAFLAGFVRSAPHPAPASASASALSGQSKPLRYYTLALGRAVR